jgi:hypothetical protein
LHLPRTKFPNPSAPYYEIENAKQAATRLHGCTRGGGSGALGKLPPRVHPFFTKLLQQEISPRRLGTFEKMACYLGNTPLETANNFADTSAWNKRPLLEQQIYSVTWSRALVGIFLSITKNPR